MVLGAKDNEIKDRFCFVSNVSYLFLNQIYSIYQHGTFSQFGTNWTLSGLKRSRS